MTFQTYKSFGNYFLTAGWDFQNRDIVAMLVTPDYVAAHSLDFERYADVSTYEVANGNGYDTGGSSVNTTVEYDETNERWRVITDSPITFTATGGSIGPIAGVIFMEELASEPNKYLIGYYPLGSNLTLTDTQELVINFHADGFVAVS